MRSMVPPVPEKSVARSQELKITRLENQLSHAIRLAKVLSRLASQLNKNNSTDISAIHLATFIEGVDQQLEELSSPQKGPLGRAAARAVYRARNDKELGIAISETVEILKIHESGWLFGRKRSGQAGWLPVSFLNDFSLRVSKVWQDKVSKWCATAPNIPAQHPPEAAPALPPKKRSSATIPLAPMPTSELTSLERLESRPFSGSGGSVSSSPSIPLKPSRDSLRGSRLGSARRVSESVIEKPSAQFDADLLAELIDEMTQLKLEQQGGLLEQEEPEDNTDNEDNYDKHHQEAKRATLGLSLDQGECDNLLHHLANFN